MCLWLGDSSCPSCDSVLGVEICSSAPSVCALLPFLLEYVARIRRARARYSRKAVPGSQGAGHELQTACHLHAVKQSWRKGEKGVWDVLRLAGDTEAARESEREWNKRGITWCRFAVSRCFWQQCPGGRWYIVIYGRLHWFADTLQEAQLIMRCSVITCSFSKPFC